MPTERTDDSLHNMTDRDFQNGETIMRDIPNFGLVSNVPLDTMHLVFLGVVKKLLNLWHCGPLNVRLSTNLINQISKKLVDLKPTAPSEFQRQPRSLQSWRQWKATELRQF